MHTSILKLHELAAQLLPRRCRNTTLALYKTRDFPAVIEGCSLGKKKKKAAINTDLCFRAE